MGGSNFQERCTWETVEGNSSLDQFILDVGGDVNYSLDSDGNLNTHTWGRVTLG
jgi:hypothetical protein